MTLVKTDQDLKTTEKEYNFREGVVEFENFLSKSEGVLLGDSDRCPLTHSFSDGIYMREIFIPKGVIVIGKIHKHEHPSFLMSGEVDIVTEEGVESFKAPCYMISPSGTKRVLSAKTDFVLVTIHYNPTNTQDLKELEKIAIAESFELYDGFVKKKGNFISRVKSALIKKLSL